MFGVLERMLITAQSTSLLRRLRFLPTSPMQLLSTLADGILRRTGLIIGATVAGTIFFAFWLPGLQTDHGASHFMDQESQTYQEFLAFGREFGFSRTVFYLSIPEIDPYDSVTLARLDSLTRRIERKSGIDHVLSLTNARIPLRRDTVYTFGPILPASHLREDIRASIEGQPFYHRLLIGRDGGSTLVLIKVNEAVNDSPAQIGLVMDVQREAGELFEQVAVAGLPYLKMQYARLVSSETPLFTVVALVISMLILFLALRSVRAVLLPTLVVGTALIWILGLMSLLHYRFNVVASVLPALMVVIGMANSVHISSRYFSYFHRTGDRKLALRDTIRTAGFSTFLTSFTTAIGFAVLTFSGFGQLSDFGLFASVSIMLLYVLSITLIPTIYHLSLPVSERALRVTSNIRIDAFFDRVAGFTQRHTRSIFVGTALTLVVGVVGTMQVPTDIYLFSDFSPGSELRRHLGQFEARHGGVLPLEVIIRSSHSGQFRRLANLRAIDSLEDELTELEGIDRVISLADLAKVANQAYLGGDPRNFRLPSALELQFLAAGLRQWVSATGQENQPANLPRFTDSTFTVARISLGVQDLGTTGMLTLADSVKARVEHRFPPDLFTTVVTGTALIGPLSSQVLVDNLIVGLAIALFVISLVMALLFRSVRLTLISIVPNVLPLLLVAGAMGFLGIELKPSTALIFSVAFGIAVDDTIHFLARYKLFQAEGLSVEVSIARTLSEAGRAVFFTTVVLVGGFSIFMLSDFGGTSSLGGLTALTLALALVSNILLLPALVYDFAPRGLSGAAPAAQSRPDQESTEPISTR